jgi:hypothetical protein
MIKLLFIIKKFLLILLIIFIFGCVQKEVITEKTQVDSIKTVGKTSEQTQEIIGGEIMKLTSPAFKEGEAIPSEYTCDGNDINPELNIEDVPLETKSLALIMDDPDAPIGTFVHWVIWNIPADIKKIEKGQEPQGIEGKTDYGKIGYGGPCPPSGTHRYFFKVYALDTKLNLEEGSSKQDLLDAMKGHIITEAKLMGRYSR